MKNKIVFGGNGGGFSPLSNLDDEELLFFSNDAYGPLSGIRIGNSTYGSGNVEQARAVLPHDGSFTMSQLQAYNVSNNMTVNYFEGNINGQLVSVGEQSPLAVALQFTTGIQVKLSGINSGSQVDSLQFDVVVLPKKLDSQFTFGGLGGNTHSINSNPGDRVVSLYTVEGEGGYPAFNGIFYNNTMYGIRGDNTVEFAIPSDGSCNFNYFQAGPYSSNLSVTPVLTYLNGIIGSEVTIGTDMQGDQPNYCNLQVGLDMKLTGINSGDLIDAMEFSNI